MAAESCTSLHDDEIFKTRIFFEATFFVLLQIFFFFFFVSKTAAMNNPVIKSHASGVSSIRVDFPLTRDLFGFLTSTTEVVPENFVKAKIRNRKT